ncbi:MAG: cell wall-binding repeat-containing protein [Desulfosporosinus sp.]
MQKKLFVVFLIQCYLLMSFRTVNAATPPVQNPSPAIIAQKLESVARQKGIPSVILKAVAFKESSWRQWDSQGNPILSRPVHPAIGIMQITSYSDLGTDIDKANIEKLKNDINYNISVGADLLNEKFTKNTPQIGDGDRNKLENWYFAIWAYNNWSVKNNPWQAKPNKAYQDAVLDWCAIDYVPGYVDPVTISKIPVEQIPQNQLPDATNGPNGLWSTPQPVHLGDLGTPPNPVRIAGADRIDTAIKIALNGWPNGSSTVILSRSDDFPDALAGVPLAHKNKAPILLTSPRSLDPRVRDALKGLNPSRIILLGGEAALSSEIEKSLAGLGWGRDRVTRLAGRDRFETAAVIAKTFSQGTPIALVTGLDFPDALSIAPAAADQNFPILLTDQVGDNLPETTRNALRDIRPASLIIVGGESVISENILKSALQAADLPPLKGRRLAGKDRYETSAMIVKAFFPQTAILDTATGEDFPDALAGAALTAHHQGALLLISPKNSLNSSAQNYLQSNQKGLVEWNVFGGGNVLPDTSLQQIQSVWDTQ